MSTQQYLFIALLCGLTLAVLAWLLRALARGSRQVQGSDRQRLNAAIYRDQLNELERDRQTGALAQADFEQARDELQQRLLEDAGSVATQTTLSAQPPARRSAIGLVVLLPLAAAGLYAWLGNPAALSARAPAAQPQVSAEQINDMVNGLAQRLQQNPDDLKGWSMLARSYKALRRHEEAVQAYENVMRLGGDQNPDLLADYADLLAVKNGGHLEGQPLELVEQALKLDPDHFTALALAGSAAYSREDYPATLKYWERLLTQLPADSEEATALTATLQDIRNKQQAAQP